MPSGKDDAIAGELQRLCRRARKRSLDIVEREAQEALAASSCADEPTSWEREAGTSPSSSLALTRAVAARAAATEAAARSSEMAATGTKGRRGGDGGGDGGGGSDGIGGEGGGGGRDGEACGERQLAASGAGCGGDAQVPPTAPPWLMVTGQPGSGKTTLVRDEIMATGERAARRTQHSCQVNRVQPGAHSAGVPVQPRNPR